MNSPGGKFQGLIFEFSNSGADAIFVEAGGPEKLGSLRFGARVPLADTGFVGGVAYYIYPPEKMKEMSPKKGAFYIKGPFHLPTIVFEWIC